MTDSHYLTSLYFKCYKSYHRNYIMKPSKYILLIVTLLPQIVINDPFGDLTVSPTSNIIQDTTDYNFTLKFIGDSTKNYTVPVGSDLLIYLPAQYPIVPATPCNCSIFGWPTAYQNISCSLNYPTIKISNAFTTAFVIANRTTYYLRWVINSIKNPKYAALTGYFSGDIRYNNTLLFSAFFPSNNQGITFAPGKLNAKLSIWPTYTDDVSNLTITITPSHSVPLTGYLKINFPMLWMGGNTPLLNNSGISLCVDINKQTNLNCVFETPYPDYIVTMNINNIYDAESMAPFTFNITNFKNPPTTGTTGSFIFQTYNTTDSAKALIDQSVIISLNDTTAAPILSPKLTLSSYQQGTSVQGIFVGTFKSTVEATDLIYFYGPPQIDLSPITNITIYESQGVIVQLTSSYIVCSCKNSITTSFPITFLFNVVKLPPYSTTITSNYQIYVMRGTAFVYSVTSPSSITLQPGKVNVSVSSTSREAGVTSTYYFNLTFTHEMSASSRITLQFSTLSFNISSGIQCQSNTSMNCAVTSTSNNIAQIKYFVADKQTSVNISISNLVNPSSVGAFTSIKVKTYNYFNNSYYLVDKNENGAFFNVTAHAMNLKDMNVTPDSYDVYATTSYNVWVRNNIDLRENSFMIIYFPSQINASSATLNGSSYVQIQQIGPLTSGTVSHYTINNVLNPISTQKTSPFKLEIYDSNGNLLEYLNSSSPQTMVNPSNLSVNIYPSSRRNSDICSYTITFSTPFAINNVVALALIMPNIQGCPNCTSKYYNTTHNEFIFYNLNMSGNTHSFIVNNFTNYDNDEIQTIKGGLLSNDQKYNYANGSTTLYTLNSSSPSFVYQFSKHQLYTPTDLTISNITSATLKSRVGSIKLEFPPLFVISSINCSNVGYLCVNTSTMIVLTVVTTGLLPQITIKNIITPPYNTDMTVTFSTHTASDHLIDQNSIIGWQADCLLPCRTCQPANSAVCNSCYSNTSITIYILYIAGNNTCDSKCGEYRYFNSTANACEKCSSSCGNCENSSTICLSCPNNQFLLNNTCYTSCPNRYFSYLTGISCLPCSTNCRTCIDEKTCSSCASPYFYYQSQCNLNCTGNTFANTSSSTCDLCPTNCSTCLFNSSGLECTSCSFGLLDDGSCLQSCKNLLKAPDTVQKICVPCDVKCWTCQQSTTFCLTCNISSYYPYFLNNTCYHSCPVFYYNNDTAFTCNMCTQPCLKCRGYSGNNCTSCIAGYSLLNSSCLANCSSTFYSNLTDCVPCVSPCWTCQSQSRCFECVSGYYFFSGNKSCVQQCPGGYVKSGAVCKICSSQCETCSSENMCSSCPPTTYLFNGTCINICPGAYYPNTTLQQCSKCPTYCTACYNSTYCTSCQTNYQLQSNSTCTTQCPTYQVSINAICTNCTSSCLTCQNTITNCTACQSNFYYAPSLFACYAACPPQLYYYIVTNTCITSCPSRTYISKNNATNVSSCISCPTYCSDCLSDSICSKCLSGAYFYNNYCNYTCPGSQPFPFNYVCQACNVVDCQTCSSIDCVVCVTGKLLIGSSLCISSCSANQIYNISNKSCDTVIAVSNQTKNNGGSGSTSTSNTSTTGVINFVPMPFLILFIFASVFIFILHFRNKLSAVPALYGIVGPIIFLCGITTIVVGFTSPFDSTLQYIGLYCVIVALALIMLAGIVSAVLWYKLCGCQKFGIIISSLFHYSIIALLTSNFNKYNSYFIESHKYFWRKYKFISKGSLVSFILFAVAGALLCYGVSDKYSYLFFAGVELSLLNTIGLVLSIIWIWIPLKQPVIEQESISQKSTEIIMGSEVEKQTQKPVEQYQQQQQYHYQKQQQYHYQKQQQQQQQEHQQQLYQKQQQQQSQHNKSRVSEVKTQVLKNQNKKKFSSANSTYEYNKLQSVIKVDKDKIVQALSQGYFRKNQKDTLKEIRKSEELNHLDDALQMNKYLGQHKEEETNQSHHKLIQKQQNIFEKEDTQYSQQNQDSPKNNRVQQSNIVGIQSRFQQKKTIQQKEVKQSHRWEEDSAQSALFEQPMVTKQLDFQHNIIFQDFDQDNITEYHEQKSEKSESFEPHLPKDSSLGEIVNKKPLLVKVEGTQKSTIRGLSPIFDRRRQETKLTVQQFQDNFIQSRIQLFNQNVKIKPAFSKELPKKPSIELPYSKGLIKKEKPIAEEEVIHADLEEIISVQDPVSLQYSELDQFDQKNVGSGSGRKLKYTKVDGDIVIREKSIPRPGDLFMQAAIHYQPGIQKNAPPEQKSISRLRGRRNK